MEYFLGEEEWERFLLASLLFESELVVPDIFLYISTHLSNHVLRSAPGQSLFEVALRERRILPAFRESTSSFRENLEEIRREGILGVRGDASALAARLDGTSGGWGTPKSLRLVDQRRRFQDMCLGILGGDGIPSFLSESTEARRLWTAADSWRCRALEQAIARTTREDGFGLRRGHLMSAVAQEFGFKGDLHDVRGLIDGLSGVPKEATAQFFRWMNEIYQASGAMAMNLSAGFPASVPEFAIVPYEMLGPREGDVDRCTLTLNVDIPPPHVLMQIPPWDLLAVGRETGAEYRSAVRQWQDGIIGAEEVRRTAAKYARELSHCAVMHDHKVKSRLEIRLQSHGINSKLLWDTVRILGFAGAYIAGSRAGMATYAFLQLALPAMYRSADRAREPKSFVLTKGAVHLVVPGESTGEDP